ncbi:MAG: hypothetical protein ING71_06905, partial [Rhodocyclaceae bacterium]|nr:hypothetical protein [Rhodocyclaceae bacterium]
SGTRGPIFTHDAVIEVIEIEAGICRPDGRRGHHLYLLIHAIIEHGLACPAIAVTCQTGMTIVCDGDRDPSRKLLGDLITTPVMAEEARAACIGDTAQAVGACGYGIGVGLNRGQRCGCRPTLDLQAIALNLD